MAPQSSPNPRRHFFRGRLRPQTQPRAFRRPWVGLEARSLEDMDLEYAELAVVLDELMSDEDALLRAVEDGATQDNIDDWLDGTGRWNRKGVPHECRWWNKTAHTIPSATFRAWFRCRKMTLQKLVQALYGTTYMFRSNNTGPWIDPCERVAVFLFRVGGGSGVRATAGHFQIAEGTVVSWTLKVARLVVERLRREYIKWPEPEEQRDIADAWEGEKGLRNVVGAIDGSHIKIPAPDEALTLAYYNYKKFYSIILLAVVDNRGIFRWVCSGRAGSCGDSGVLQATGSYKRAQEELAGPPSERTVFADGACILGDSAFAEGPWLRTPITLCATREKRYFNYKHSSMRMRVEHAFGRLKWKFLVLQRGLLFKLDDAALIIDACCVLYNFIFLHEGAWTSHQPVDDAQTRNGSGRAAGAGGPSNERDAEVAYLASLSLQEEWGDPGSMADRRREEREREWMEPIL